MYGLWSWDYFQFQEQVEMKLDEPMEYYRFAGLKKYVFN